MSMNGIVDINQGQLINTMGAAHKLNRPLMVWGSPGIGKSDIAKTFAERIGAVLCDIRLGQYDSVDLRGLPDASTDGNMTVWLAPSTLPFKNNPDWPDDQPIVLFLDEAMQAAPAVQSVAFQLVLDRRVGEHELRDNVWIIAASNRETDRAGVNKMLSPLANRFMHVQLNPTLDGWKDWAYQAGIHEIPMAYLNTRPDFLDHFEAAQKSSMKAFPTPRAWAAVSAIFHEYGNDPAMLDILVSATVGTGVAAELLQFARMAHKLPTLQDVVDDPTGVTVPSANDERYCMCTMLAYRCTPETGEQVIAYVKRFDQQYQVLFMADYTRRAPMDVINSESMLAYQTELHGVIYG